jgi:hypothetical protein
MKPAKKRIAIFLSVSDNLGRTIRKLNFVTYVPEIMVLQSSINLLWKLNLLVGRNRQVFVTFCFTYQCAFSDCSKIGFSLVNQSGSCVPSTQCHVKCDYLLGFS